MATDSSLLLRLVDHLPAMVAYWDAELRCRFANRAYETWFGVSADQMIGRDMAEFLGPLFEQNRPHIEGALRGEPQTFEREIPDPAGGEARFGQAHYVPDVVDGAVLGFCVLVADVTARRRAEAALQAMERQVQASERFAALATLAGGIGHEINNPLASLLADLELILASLDAGAIDPASLRSTLLESRSSATRIRDIVRDMTLLAGGDATRRELVDVNAVIEKSIEVTAPTLRYRARVIRDLDPVGTIDGNAARLLQVLVNLLLNAAQALPVDRTLDNEIRVATRRRDDQIVVAVEDNGSGIPDDDKARVFDPFFTTRSVGLGLGLGLSICSGIVRSLGGTISVRDAARRGSVFEVVLPAARAAATEAPPAEDRSPPARTGARLLIIDDEPWVAKGLQRILAVDHEVVMVHRGRDALAHLTGDGAPAFDLVLCDLMMPDLGGQDLYVEVVQHRPELARRFVFMTGGAFTRRAQEFLDQLPVPVLAKPFDVATLREIVATQLAVARDPSP